MDTPVEIRELQADDLTASWELGRLAFGSSSPQPPPTPDTAAEGITRYGAFDPGGRLVGRAADLHDEQWWAGRRVAAADIAGVAVLPEARGRGVARALLGAILRGARQRGAAISTLFPTVAAPYRSCGWEIGGTLRTVDLATMALPAHRPSSRLSVRPGTAADLPAVAGLYEQVARHRSGLLTRQDWPTPAGAESGLPEDVDGLTLVHDGDRLVGYASWQRGPGYDATAVLTVHDLFAVTTEAAQELVGVLAGWRSVTPTLRLRLLRHDAVSMQLPLEIAREHQRQMWMHRPVDVVRAVQSRGWPPHVRGTVDFALDDVLAPWNAGAWRLEVTDGAARLQRTDCEPALRLAVQGFGLLYLGAATAQAVAEAGLLQCAPGADPGALDLLGAGQQAELLDYF